MVCVLIGSPPVVQCCLVFLSIAAWASGALTGRQLHGSRRFLCRFSLLDSQSVNQSVGTSLLLIKTGLSRRNDEHTLETVSEAAKAWVTNPSTHELRIFCL